MSTTNWIIAVVVVAILGVGAYYYFDNDMGSDAMMEHGSGQLRTNPNATGTDMMMGTSSDSMDNGGSMNATGTVKVNVY